jgi:hypothetical protein
MAGVSRLSCHACRLVLAALLVTALLAVTIGQRKGVPTRAVVPPDDWDIPTLVTYLNGQGLGLHMVSTQKDGVIRQTAFLTTTDKGWSDFNRLANDHNQIAPWQGTLYCEQGPGGNLWSDLIREWRDSSLVVGPFLLYGDHELLDRVRAALTALGQPPADPPRPRPVHSATE